MKNIFKKSYYSNRFIWIIILIGLSLRLHQYFLNHTLWLDEAFIAINIIRSNYLDLLFPLKYYNQAAPIVFLLVTKFITKLWGISEYAFRFFSLISGIGSVIIAYFLGKKFLDKKALPLFLLLMAFSRYGIYYSSELKQYSLELLVTIIILIFSINIYNSNYNLKTCLITGILGGFLVFCSYTAAFILTGTWLALFVSCFIKKKEIKEKNISQKNIIYLILSGTIWLISFISNYLLFVKKSATPVFYQYWKVLDSFPPFPPKTTGEFLWYPKTFLNLIKDPLGLAFHLSNINKIPFFIIVIQYIVVILLIIIGTYNLVKTKQWFKTLLIYLPVTVVLLVALLGYYPLYGRLELFILPIVYLLIAEGGFALIYLLKKKWKLIGILILIYLFSFPIFYGIYNIIKPDIRHETKPVIEYYLANRKPEDLIYIYTPTSEEPVFIYYTQYYYKNQLKNQIQIDKDFDKNRNKYLSELMLKTKDKGLWIIFPFKTEQEQEILDFLNARFKKDKEYKSAASIYYFTIK